MKIWLNFFESHYSLPCLFHKLMKNEYVRHSGTLYHLSYNSHPDCQRVKMQLVKGLSIEDPGLWKICPKEYRHLLHNERRQELNKSVKKQYIKTLKTLLCTILKKVYNIFSLLKNVCNVFLKMYVTFFFKNV